MAVISAATLRESAQVYMNEWAVLSVNDEPLIPFSSDGKKWISRWDNWLFPPTAGSPPYGSIEPLILVSNVAIARGSGAGKYVMVDSGDAKRGQIEFGTAPTGTVDAVVLASFRRALFRDEFWARVIPLATDQVANMLLLGSHLDSAALDDESSPWAIIVKQAGRICLENLQTLLAGLGRTKVEGIDVDLARAGSTIDKTLLSLSREIDNEVVSWRWRASPLPLPALSNPYRWWGGC